MPDKPLPFRVLERLARGLGKPRWLKLLETLYALAFRLPPQRGIILSRLKRMAAHAGESLPPDRLSRVADEMAKLFAVYQADLLLPEDPPSMLERPVELPLLPELEALRGQGRGVILAAAHFGHQPLLMTALCSAGIPLDVLVVNAEPYRWAERPGLRFITLGNAAHECLAALKRNEAALIYCDLDFFPGGRTADFFGAPARPPHGAARLALASGAPLLPIYMICEGGRHRLECDAAIAAEAGQEGIENAILRSMERRIARHPSHWFLFRDIWNLEKTGRDLRAQLAAVRSYNALSRLLG